MNERIQELAYEAEDYADGVVDQGGEFHPAYTQKLAELIVQEFSSLLFDESERLYAYSTECDNMRESDDAELVAEKCIDLIAMIEQHFGVEE